MSDYHRVTVRCNECAMEDSAVLHTHRTISDGDCICGGRVFRTAQPVRKRLANRIVTIIALALVALVIWLNYASITAPDTQCMFDATADVERCAKGK